MKEVIIEKNKFNKGKIKNAGKMLYLCVSCNHEQYDSLFNNNLKCDNCGLPIGYFVIK
jgi:hypothetical protein